MTASWLGRRGRRPTWGCVLASGGGQEAEFGGASGGLSAVGDPELPDGVRYVELGGSLADSENLRDLPSLLPSASDDGYAAPSWRMRPIASERV